MLLVSPPRTPTCNPTLVARYRLYKVISQVFGSIPSLNVKLHSCDEVVDSQLSPSKKKRKKARMHFEDYQESGMLSVSPAASRKKNKKKKRKVGELVDAEYFEDSQPSTVPSSQEAGSPCDEIVDGQWFVSPIKGYTSHFKDGKEKETAIFCSPKRSKKKKKRKGRELEALYRVHNSDEDTQMSSVDVIPQSFQRVDSCDEINFGESSANDVNEGSSQNEGISNLETVTLSSPIISKKRKKRKGRHSEESRGETVEDTQVSGADIVPSSLEIVHSCDEVGDSQLSPSKKKRKKARMHFGDDQESGMLSVSPAASHKKNKKKKRKVVELADAEYVEDSQPSTVPSSQEADGPCNETVDGQWIVSPIKNYTSHSKDGNERVLSGSPKSTKEKKKRKGRQLEALFSVPNYDEDTQTSSVDVVPLSFQRGDTCDEITFGESLAKGLNEDSSQNEGISNLETVTLSSPIISKKRKKRKGRHSEESCGETVEDTQVSGADIIPSSLKIVDSCDEINFGESLAKGLNEDSSQNEGISNLETVILSSPIIRKKRKKRKRRQSQESRGETVEDTQVSSVDIVPSSLKIVDTCDEISFGESVMPSTKNVNEVSSRNVGTSDLETVIFSSQGKSNEKRKRKEIHVEELCGEAVEETQVPGADVVPSSLNTVDSCNDIAIAESATPSTKNVNKESSQNEDISNLKTVNLSSAVKKKKRKGKQLEESCGETVEGTRVSSPDVVPSSLEIGDSHSGITLGESVTPSTKNVNKESSQNDDISNLKTVNLSSAVKKKKREGKQLENSCGETVEGTQVSSPDIIPSSLEIGNSHSGITLGESVTPSTKNVHKDSSQNDGISDVETLIFSSPERSKKSAERHLEESFEETLEKTQMSSPDVLASSFDIVDSCGDITFDESFTTPARNVNEHSSQNDGISDAETVIFSSPERSKEKKEVKGKQLEESCEDTVAVSKVPSADVVPSSPVVDPNSCDKEKVVEVFKDLLMKEEFPESEYTEMLETLSENSRPSDDVIKRLSELCVVVKWSVHPTHQVESRVARPPTGEELQQMECLSGGMKKGRYVLSEDKIIKDNWEKFKQEYGFENPKDFMCVRMGNTYLLPPKEFKNFVRYLGRGLPNRTLHSVLTRFRRLFQDNVQGRLPKEWKILFQKHLERYGKKFSGLKSILGKSSRNLSCSAGYIVGPKKAKSFKSLEAKTELFKAILQVTKSKSYEELKGKTIEWSKVSEILNVRSESCRLYWNRYLSGFLAFEKPTPKRVIIGKLIECLKRLNVSCSSEVDWNKISPKVFNLPSTFLWHAFARECEKFCIKYTGDKWKEAISQMSALQNTMTPGNMKEPMYECCRFVNSKIVYIL
ncbi:uncharacterized protein LOC124158861 isoform X3 [Ischnura elegans]|uniref:uncharacterized protein LOC124158861 isoform X3 n=1 Tax=Ischnura elegans TaxID=197161 RepID=UPI001ED8A333|nr:uncharacterized protein LOC124158861 isoform X3 [Ischnura elegans]